MGTAMITTMVIATTITATAIRMAHGHSHGPGGHHDHAAGASSRRIAIALGLNLSILGAELAGAWFFGSLALLSDAAHMFTDAAALGIALAALAIAKRPADDKRSFGYRRFEILAAAFNAVACSSSRASCWSRASAASSIRCPSSRSA